MATNFNPNDCTYLGTINIINGLKNHNNQFVEDKGYRAMTYALDNIKSKY